MSQRTFVGAVVLAALASSALADNEITVWYATGTYLVEQDAHTVLITSAGTFKVQATDGANLGHIRSITVAPDVSGTVNLYILRDPEEGGGNGAQDVEWVNLSNATTGNIAELRVLRYLGHDEGAEDTQAAAIAGTFIVGKAVEKDVIVGTLASGASLSIYTLSANLEVTGSGPHAGSIDIEFFTSPDKTISITGTITGEIVVGCLG
ncbi:MAG: hypothetical protein ABIG44_01875 [Planctomycetota bacterium]